MLEELLSLLPENLAVLLTQLLSLGSLVILLMEAFKEFVKKVYWRLMTYLIAEIIVCGYGLTMGNLTWLHLFAGILVGAAATGEYRLLFERLFGKK